MWSVLVLSVGGHGRGLLVIDSDLLKCVMRLLCRNETSVDDTILSSWRLRRRGRDAVLVRLGFGLGIRVFVCMPSAGDARARMDDY